MSISIQNLLVLMAVGGCAYYIIHGAYRALHGRKSQIGGCGACSGCAAPKSTLKQPAERVVMVPLDALIRTQNRRSANKSNSH